MNTPPKGALRQDAVPVTQAFNVLQMLKQQRNDLDELLKIVSDLNFDYLRIRELRYIEGHLEKAKERLERAFPYAYTVWGMASAAADVEVRK